MNIFFRIIKLLPLSILFGLGMGAIYLVYVLYFATGHFSDIFQLTDSLDQINEVLTKQP